MRPPPFFVRARARESCKRTPIPPHWAPIRIAEYRGTDERRRLRGSALTRARGYRSPTPRTAATVACRGNRSPRTGCCTILRDWRTSRASCDQPQGGRMTHPRTVATSLARGCVGWDPKRERRMQASDVVRRVGYVIAALVVLAAFFQLFWRYKYVCRGSRVVVWRIDRLTESACVLPCWPKIASTSARQFAIPAATATSVDLNLPSPQASVYLNMPGEPTPPPSPNPFDDR